MIYSMLTIHVSTLIIGANKEPEAGTYDPGAVQYVQGNGFRGRLKSRILTHAYL